MYSSDGASGPLTSNAGALVLSEYLERVFFGERFVRSGEEGIARTHEHRTYGGHK